MSEHEHEASAPQQEAVRRLLADARHAEPLPREVVDRLDGVLAQLTAEGARAVDAPPPAPRDAVVVDLAARRRRRVRGLLGAAAAVVVLGVGVTQLVDLGPDDGSDSGGDVSSSRASDDQAEAGRELDGGARDAPTAAAEPNSAESGSLAGGGLPPTVPELTRRGFQDSVLQLRKAAFVTSLDDQARLDADDLTSEAMFVCPPTTWGPGRLVPVTYAQAPAVLVYRPATGDTQSVELLQCGTADVLRSVVIPFP